MAEQTDKRRHQDEARAELAAAWTPFSRRAALYGEERDGESGADTVRRIIREHGAELARLREAVQAATPVLRVGINALRTSQADVSDRNADRDAADTLAAAGGEKPAAGEPCL